MADRKLSSLNRRLKRVTRRLELGIVELISHVAEEIGREIVPATPVDTGFARANWRPSVNAPASEPITFLDKTGEATVSNIAVVARLYQLGDVFFIVNLVPYIGDLNEGSSPQAPVGFVQIAIASGVKRGVLTFQASRPSRGLI